jgi:hypothetical protein
MGGILKQGIAYALFQVGAIPPDEAVMMVSGGMTLTQVAEAIFPYPTQAELFGELARRLLARLRRTAKAKA